jgi:hypothetical protein
MHFYRHMSKLPSSVQIQLSFVADIEFENARTKKENAWESVPKGVIVKLRIDLNWLRRHWKISLWHFHFWIVMERSHRTSAVRKLETRTELTLKLPSFEI